MSKRTPIERMLHEPNLATSEPSEPEWIVLHYDIQSMRYTEIGCTRAASAGQAFRNVTMRPNEQWTHPFGEYRVFSLDGAARLGVELQLRDLDAKV